MQDNRLLEGAMRLQPRGVSLLEGGPKCSTSCADVRLWVSAMTGPLRLSGWSQEQTFAFLENC